MAFYVKHVSSFLNFNKIKFKSEVASLEGSVALAFELRFLNAKSISLIKETM